LASSPTILAAPLFPCPILVASLFPSPSLFPSRIGSDLRDLYADAHRDLDRLLLPRVMEYARGSQHQAALLLGIARQTLRLKLRDLGLSITRPSETDEDDSG
jgi:DNA-binding NtrC family response regulator